MQPGRDVSEENIMQRVYSNKKTSNRAINELLAPKSFYQDTIYQELYSISPNQFILSFFKELLEKTFHRTFEMPKPELPFSKQEIEKTLQKKKIQTPYIVFVPFTSTPIRNWPLERFVYLAKELEKKVDLPIVIVGKSKISHRNVWKNCPNVIDLVNKTTLFEGMQIAAGAKYAVCSDTSLMHCALMGGAKTISLSCGRAKDLFVNYPASTGVKQKIFFPSLVDEQGIGLIENIDTQPVWKYIQQEWFSW